MLNIDHAPLKNLMRTLPQTGTVVWVGVRHERRQPLRQVACVAASSAKGLEGDHFSSQRNQKRQVTLIQEEHLQTVASLLDMEKIDPALTRRNLVIKGINLFALKNQKFSIGDVVLEGTGYCHPCSRMEENLGPGGYNAMRGHGGITARILKDGIISQGNRVRLITDEKV